MMPTRYPLCRFIVAVLVGVFVSAGKVNGAGIYFPALGSGPTEGTTGKFRIIWHIGPQVEELADPSIDAQEAIGKISRVVDGYYLLFVNNGPLRYWPNRPESCSLNLRVIEQKRLRVQIGTQVIDDTNAPSVVQDCDKSFTEFKNALSGGATDTEAAYTETYKSALRRVVENLKRGDTSGLTNKNVIAEILVSNRFFDEDPKSGRIRVTKLPLPLEVLSRSSTNVSNVMLYQEPALQGPRGTLLPSCSARPCKTTLSTKEASQLTNALITYYSNESSAGRGTTQAPSVLVDIRRWQNSHSTLFRRDQQSEAIKGVVFESGTTAALELYDGKKSILSANANGAAWLLKHTDKAIFFLMPNNLSPQNINAKQNQNLTSYVMSLNEEIQDKLGFSGGLNPICNNRVHFVPAGYGSPITLRQFPSDPSQSSTAAIAGITSQIIHLDKIRSKLCQ